MSATTAMSAEKAAASSIKPSSSANCSFIVTGFGPFHGVPDNPTSVLVRRLQAHLAQEEQNGEDAAATTPPHKKNSIETHILETSAEYVRTKLDDIYDQLKTTNNQNQDAANGQYGENAPNEAKKKVILLHLGVNYRGRQFQIERCAYNDATFRVPDERGYQPHRECILVKDETSEASQGHKWGKRLNTTLDVQHLCQEMKQYNTTVVSQDPGRFVCNYTYCLSLDKCHMTNTTCNGKEGDEEDGSRFHSLFVHVPPFEIVSEDGQFEFLLRLMEAIERQLMQVPEE
mmetsp:Transcript_7470/g.13160  ORF Transcript_7470/g.13160 Transcript_7470/m.13160 type:complete len:287 (+) Transcript_7470:117-977(+)